MTRASLLGLLALPVLLAAANPVAAQSRCTRADLQSAVDGYLENTAVTPLGKGQPDDSCNVGVPADGGMKLTGNRFIADPDVGAVVAFITWPTTVPDSHLFRIENGRIRFVHSLTVCTVPNCGFPQLGPPKPAAK